jgi:hypothetical protein
MVANNTTIMMKNFAKTNVLLERVDYQVNLFVNKFYVHETYSNSKLDGSWEKHFAFLLQFCFIECVG